MNVDLQGLDLAAKWPKLLKLEQDRANFRRRHEKACLVGERRAKVEHDLLRMAEEAEGGGGKL
jgi:hypothetical protein